MHFPNHKLAIGIDEKGQSDRPKNKEKRKKKNQNENLAINLLGLTLTRKNLMFLLKFVKYVTH